MRSKQKEKKSAKKGLGAHAFIHPHIQNHLPFLYLALVAVMKYNECSLLSLSVIWFYVCVQFNVILLHLTQAQ